MGFDSIPTKTQWENARGVQFSPDPLVQRIDGYIERYHQVFEMAKLNILMALKDLVIQWAAKTGVPSQVTLPSQVRAHESQGKLLTAMRDLEEIVLRELRSTTRWTSHRYEHVVCIGYQIKLGQYQGPDATYFGESAATMDAVAVNAADDLDIAARCQQMIAVIQAAREGYVGRRAALLGATGADLDAKDRKTLKIFMAPEFFFRGKYGAYQMEKLWDIMPLLREETGKTAYNDWLFVLGTAITRTQVMKPDQHTLEGLILDNWALIQKGGFETSDGIHDYFTEKEITSIADFRSEGTEFADTRSVRVYDETQAAVTAVKAIPAPGSRDMTDKSTWGRTSERVGGAIFTMDGITFAIEICKDHLEARLKKYGDISDLAAVQVQLIPSAGADIQRGSLANSKVIAFNVDGERGDASTIGNAYDAPDKDVQDLTKAGYFDAGPASLRFFRAENLNWGPTGTAKAISDANAALDKAAIVLEQDRGRLTGAVTAPKKAPPKWPPTG